MQAFVYILHCADGSYYTGLTKQDPEARAWEHNHEPIDSYTGAGLWPWSSRNPMTSKDAIARERQVKGWSRRKKEALIRGAYEDLPELASRPTLRVPE